MAKKAKTTADQSALDAVENALSIDFDEMDNSDEPELAKLERKIADTVDTLRENRQAAEETVSEPAPVVNEKADEELESLIPETPPSAANDDHDDDLNELLYAIQQKPKNSVFLWSFVASAIWLGLCAYYGYVNIWPEVAKPATIASLSGNFQVMTLVAVAFIPLMPLWGLAFMMRRALEMRHAASAMTQVSMRLLQPEKISTDSIATVGTAIRREMTAIGDGVERAIARAGELEFMVQKEVMSLERSYGDSEVRLRRLIDDIGTEREEVISHAEKLRNSITESQNGFTEQIDTATTRIDESLKTASGNIAQTLDAEGVSITSRLKDTSEGLLDLLSRTGSDITDSLNDGTEKLRENVDNQVREFSEVVSTSGHALATLIDDRTASFDTAATNVADKLETGKKAFDITFNERNEDLGKILATAGQSVSTLLKSSSAELAERSNSMLMDFEDKRKHLETTFNHQTEQFGKLTELAADNLASAVEAGSDRFEESASKIAQHVEDNLTIRATDFESRISETSGSLEAAMVEKIQLIENTLSTSGSNLVSALGMRTEALDKVLRERAETIGETIAERLSGFGQSLTGHVDEAVTHLKSQTEELQENTKAVEDIISQRTKSVEEAIKSGTIEFASGLKESLLTTAEKSAELNTALTNTARNFAETTESSKETVARALEQTSEAIGKQLTDGSQELALSLSEKQEELTSNLNANTRFLQEAMEERANNLSSKLNQGIHRVSSALVTKGSEAAEDFERVVGALEERMHKSSHNIEKQFAAGSKILRESLDEGQQTLLEAVSNSVSEAGTAIDGKAEKLSELLTERATMINDTLGSSLLGTQRELEAKTAELNELLSSRGSEISTSLDERISELNASLSARSTELSNIIENDAKPIIASLETAGEAINTQLTGMGNVIAEQANSLFSNLAESNEHLESLIKSAGNNLSLMQTAVSQQSADFAETVNISKSELEASNKIAIEAEEKLQSASANLMQNMGSIANRLEAQGSVLQDATRLIDAAQSNLEQTLDEKQQSLQDLSSGLMMKSDEISSSVTSFAQMISSMVDDMSSKSRGAGGAIAAEVSSAIDDATARFSDSVDAMRSAAATIRKELDDTREQMRRGVLELPDETAQSAAAMRRVVTDQIAALKDLSSIVERSGKVLDTSSAVPQARAVGHDTRTQRQVPAGNFPPDTRPASPPPAFDSTLRGSQPAYAPAPQNIQPQAPVDNADNVGWVSDLLRRASRDEPARQPAPLPDTRSPDHMVESLNSLSMDIASAIDHEASIDLWERYQRGETNVFTRRLYTLQGQQTFDEIRSKFAQNGDFRNAVNRYIDDFERLLSDVSRTDQGGTMAQSYLTSDTGKVYTMLAHAAGRFGNG